LRRVAAAQVAPKILRAELEWELDAPGGLGGSGLIIVNPPWRLAEELEPMLAHLLSVLGPAVTGRGKVDWLAGLR
jgi:23S rRNA (adenine2030-N6)-methyltransferase